METQGEWPNLGGQAPSPVGFLLVLESLQRGLGCKEGHRRYLGWTRANLRQLQGKDSSSAPWGRGCPGPGGLHSHQGPGKRHCDAWGEGAWHGLVVLIISLPLCSALMLQLVQALPPTSAGTLAQRSN